MTPVRLTQLSISMEDAMVSRWLVGDGEPVAAGQPIVELETDKATVEIEAPAAGVLHIVAAEGVVVVVDGLLAEVEPAGVAAVPQERAPASTAAVASHPAAPAAGPVAAEVARPARSGPIASPAARRVARERAVELAAVRGSGPGGRVVVRDVVASGSGVVPAPAGGKAAVSDDALREAVVRNITASWQQIPHVHIGGELNAEGLVRARAALAGSDIGATITDLLVVALARALADVPELNGWRRADGSVERAADVHLSLAVATPTGVLAPVLRNAGARTLAEVSRERRRLVEAARDGSADGRDLAGGTCTLSNLGAYPVDFFAPVVSGPQIAMIATGRVAERVVAVDGWVGVRPRMWVNVAIDHRAADGEAGGRLLAALERQLATLPGGPA